MVIRTVGVCTDNCKQMVYQFQPATYGDIHQDCRTPRSRYKRTVKNRKKQVIVLKGRWCIPLSTKTAKKKIRMDKKTLEFVTYCIGKLSALLQLPQKEIYKRLKTSGILYGYIVPSYDVLHTFSSRYLMEDLTEYMKEKGVL